MAQPAVSFHPLFKIHTIILFIVLNLAAIVFIIRRHLAKKYEFDYKIQQLQEKVNVLSEQITREGRVKSAQEARKNRYQSLKKLIEGINKEFDQVGAADKLINAAFSLIAENRGACLLYLVDKQSQRLSLFKVKKENRGMVIKAKEGDIFDSWVLRHTAPLFVEDVSKDYRFDTGRAKEYEKRQVGSLISAPLVTDQGLIGVMRLEQTEANFYSQDDLRFLSTICDLGAVALESSELYKRIEDLATHDSLTTFTTRGYFLEALKEEVKRGLRLKGAFSLMMVDIDYFKKYNDRFGHSAGDEVLKILSRILKENLAKLHPMISRYGGEEFSVILLGINKQEAVRAAVELCVKVEKEKIVLRRQETGITISIGVAAFPEDAQDAEGLIKKSDDAMYRAKERGRNRVCSA
ncbi:MAG: sensor domain-containing diguanylate cyclase [Candidatus Omnitrophica bacterium]|nr:sensor domain-containing diguanylate cyclase [Candidatus Omnitrophota bacterium]